MGNTVYHTELRRAGMERIDRIWRHPKTQECLTVIRQEERGRKFCQHQLGHLMDVARIAYILNLEEGLGIPKDVIYGAALLHDIGKGEQYQAGLPHEQAGAVLAEGILEDCGYGDGEREQMRRAILSHRDWSAARQSALGSILYRADKASRACFACEAEAECDWVTEKKNLSVRY